MLSILPAYEEPMLKTYTEGVPQKCSLKKAFCCRYVAYLQKNTHTEV